MDDIESRWRVEMDEEAPPAPLTPDDLKAIVSLRTRKAFLTTSRFVWTSLVNQIVLYSFLAYTLVHRWDDPWVPLLCALGAALQAPLTAALLRRTGRLFRPSPSVDLDLSRSVAGEEARLADFFRFKKRLDLVGVPLTSAIVVLVTFALFVPGGVAENPRGSLVVLALWLAIAARAVQAENEKRFASPLRHLAALREELRAGAA